MLTHLFSGESLGCSPTFCNRCMYLYFRLAKRPGRANCTNSARRRCLAENPLVRISNKSGVRAKRTVYTHDLGVKCILGCKNGQGLPRSRAPHHPGTPSERYPGRIRSRSLNRVAERSNDPVQRLDLFIGDAGLGDSMSSSTDCGSTMEKKLTRSPGPRLLSKASRAA